MHTFVLVHLLNPLPIGNRFPSRKWPLHLTVLPPFRTSAAQDSVETAIREAASGPITVVVGERAMFGSRRDIPVMELRTNQEIQTLHEAIMQSVENLGVEWKDSRHIGRGYRPHVTDQSAGSASPDQSITVDSVTLVDMTEPGVREVLGTVPLES